jgi:polyisoprenoid-binding protein YceI
MLQRLLGGPAVAVWLFAQAAAPAGFGPTVLTINAADSSVVILVGKTGVLSFAGHAHEVLAPSVSGRVTFDPADWQHASVSLEFDASALRVTGKGDSPTDVPEVQRVMLSGQVLDVTRFPTIAFQSRRVSVTARTATSADVLIEGDMVLHGTTRPMTIRAAVALDAGGRVTARGSFSLKQTEFGMVPVTAVGGTVRVKDELDIQFVLKASPSHDTSAAR